MDHSVCADVNADQLCAAWRGVQEGAIGGQYASGVQNPKPVKWVEDYGLHADEVVLVVCACGRLGGVVDGSTRRIIDLCVGIGRLRVVGGEFSDCIASDVPSIGVVGVETSYTSC